MCFRVCIFLHQVSHGFILYTVLVPYWFKEGTFENWLASLFVLLMVPFLVATHCMTSSTKSIAFKRKRDGRGFNDFEKARYETCKKCVSGDDAVSD